MDFDPQGFARRLNELLVLAALRSEGKHGYQVALDVEEESGGLVTFKHGTLYPILHRLEDEGLIAGAWSDGGGARRRKVYELTPAGREALALGGRECGAVFDTLRGMIVGPDAEGARGPVRRGTA